MTAESPSVVASLRRLATHALALAQVRLELFSLDAQDALTRALTVFFLAAVAVVALGLGLVFLALLLTVLLWDTHRVLALAAGVGVFVGLGAAAGWGAWATLRRSPGWFAATLAELKADRQHLDGAP